MNKKNTFRHLFYYILLIALFLLVGCTPADNPVTSTPINSIIPTETNTPIPADPGGSADPPTPTFTPTASSTPLPEIVGHVEIGAGGPCGLFKWGLFEIAGNDYDVYFTDPDGCKKIEQEGIQWINATYINDERVYYQKPEMHLELTDILEEFNILYPTVGLNQIDIHAVYDEGRGIACSEEGGEIGDISVCVTLSQDGKYILHLAIVIQKYIPPVINGGNDSGGTTCPPERQKPDGGCCPCQPSDTLCAYDPIIQSCVNGGPV